MLKQIDLTEATSLSVCQYMDKCEQKGERLIEYFYRLPEKSEMPEYYENVPNPIDLVTIISRTIGGYYKYLEDFVDDVQLMLENALNFNAPARMLTTTRKYWPDSIDKRCSDHTSITRRLQSLCREARKNKTAAPQEEKNLQL